MCFLCVDSVADIAVTTGSYHILVVKKGQSALAGMQDRQIDGHLCSWSATVICR